MTSLYQIIDAKTSWQPGPDHKKKILHVNVHDVGLNICQSFGVATGLGWFKVVIRNSIG